MLERRRLSILILMVSALFTLAFQACHAGDDSGQISVSILSPANASTVAVGMPVAVQASASDADGAGVVRIDLLVNGVAVDTFEAASAQANLSAELSFTPTAEGAASVAVIAYRSDGTPSNQAAIALQVVGLTQESSSSGGNGNGEQPAGEQPADEQPAAEEPPPAQDFSPDISMLTFARANVLVNIRERPGPGCLIIGKVDEGAIIEFLEETDFTENNWYKVPLNTRQTSVGAPDGANYVPPEGGEEYGWVFFGQNFTLVTDDNTPKVRELGCLFCGDGVCSAEIGEACDVCVQDCGVCPFCGDGVVNQSNEQCDGSGSVCGTDYTCSGSCTCIAPTPVPFCGDGIVNQVFEACDGDGSVCGANWTCSASCGCVAPPIK